MEQQPAGQKSQEFLPGQGVGTGQARLPFQYFLQQPGVGLAMMVEHPGVDAMNAHQLFLGVEMHTGVVEQARKYCEAFVL